MTRRGNRMNRFEKRDNTTQVVLIVMGSVLGVVLVTILVCGGLAFFAVVKASNAAAPQIQAAGERMAADAAVQVFLNELSVGQVEAAYESTTPAFRARQSLAQFKKFVDRNPMLTKFTTAEPAPLDNAPGAQQLTLHYTLNGDKAPLNVTVQVVKDGEQWKVDSVGVP
jgi:hypothetical protein